MLAEFFRVQIDQAAPVVVFLRRHVEKYLGAVGELLTQPLGEIGVDTAVLLLRADRQSQDLALGQGREIAHTT